MEKTFKTGDIVFTVWKDNIGRWKITGQKSKTIFYVQSTAIKNPLRQVETHEKRISEFLSFEDAKKKLTENKIKEFEIEMKRIKNLSE